MCGPVGQSAGSSEREAELCFAGCCVLSCGMSVGCKEWVAESDGTCVLRTSRTGQMGAYVEERQGQAMLGIPPVMNSQRQPPPA